MTCLRQFAFHQLHAQNTSHSNMVDHLLGFLDAVGNQVSLQCATLQHVSVFDCADLAEAEGHFFDATQRHSRHFLLRRGSLQR